MITQNVWVNLVSILGGTIFGVGCLLVWFSGYIPALKRWMEALFVPGEDLFDAKASYAGTVLFFRWWGLLIGFLFVLPTFVIFDLLIFLCAIMLWRYFAKKAREELRA